MAQNRDKFATEIRAILIKLTAMLEELDAGAIVVTPEIAAKVSEFAATGRCLQCKLVKEENYRRGLCGACYRRTQLSVAAGKDTFADLERDGLLAAKGKPGREPAKRTLLDDHIAARAGIAAPPAPDFTDVATGDASPGATEATEKEAVKPHKGLSTGEVAPDSGVRPPQGKRAKVKPKGK